ncbi:FAD:protein FMN transferase [uncultured Neptuniibacter sp.]|uniref:FAD:protein FMN transferase n=1 Tax=uncultured Neptuniibacter sp. TaxID=502143 RepID=UPI0026139378|nr:FAD:protein FMN transferase [uncultured Neptuniibacter sp.]
MFVYIRQKPKWPAALLSAILFLCITLLQGCGEKEPQLHTHSGMTMGTTFTVKWFSRDSNHAAVSTRINRLLADVNQSMSTYIPDSELSRFNRLPANQKAEVSPALSFVVGLGLNISERTSGAFDITVGPLVNLWGFGPDGRVVKAPSEQEIEAVRHRIGYQSIQLNNNLLSKNVNSYVDLSAIAKGYGVDVIAEFLEKSGIDSYLVEIGGELRAKGLKPDGQNWRIAIESPVSGPGREIQKIIAVKDVGIATSGDYRNYFEENGVRFSHTIDPNTARPITHRLASVTVLAETCAEADALATAMMVMGADKARVFAETEAIEALFLVKSDKGFEEFMTSGFKQYLVN